MTDEYRIKHLEQEVRDLSGLPGRVAVLETDQRTMGREIGELKGSLKEGLAELKEDGKATRRMLVGFSLTIAGSAIAAVITLLLTIGPK